MNDISNLVNDVINRTEKLKSKLTEVFYPEHDIITGYINTLIKKHNLSLNYISFTTGIRMQRLRRILSKKCNFNHIEARVIWFLYIAFEEPGAYYEPDKQFYIAAWGLPTSMPDTKVTVKKYKQAVETLEQYIDKGGNVDEFVLARALDCDIGISHSLLRGSGLSKTNNFYSGIKNYISFEKKEFHLMPQEQHCFTHDNPIYFIRPANKLYIAPIKNETVNVIYKDIIVAKYRVIGIERYFSDEINIDIWKKSALYDAEKDNSLQSIIGFKNYNDIQKLQFPLRFTFIVMKPLEVFLTYRI